MKAIRDARIETATLLGDSQFSFGEAPYPGRIGNLVGTCFTNGDLSANQECTIVGVFRATLPGSYRGTLRLFSSSVPFPIDRVLSADACRTAILSINSDSRIDIPETATGSSRTVLVQVLNKGENDAALRLRGLILNGTQENSSLVRFTNGAFPGHTGSGACGPTLASGASCTLSLTFAPTTVVAGEWTLTILFDTLELIDNSASQRIRFRSFDNSPKKLGLSVPTEPLMANVCAGVVVQILNFRGQETPLPVGNDLRVTLRGVGDGTLHEAANCSDGAVTETTVSGGSSRKLIFFKGLKRTRYSLTASTQGPPLLDPVTIFIFVLGTGEGDFSFGPNGDGSLVFNESNTNTERNSGVIRDTKYNKANGALYVTGHLDVGSSPKKIDGLGAEGFLSRIVNGQLDPKFGLGCQNSILGISGTVSLGRVLASQPSEYGATLLIPEITDVPPSQRDADGNVPVIVVGHRVGPQPYRRQHIFLVKVDARGCPMPDFGINGRSDPEDPGLLAFWNHWNNWIFDEPAGAVWSPLGEIIVAATIFDTTYRTTRMAAVVYRPNGRLRIDVGSGGVVVADFSPLDPPNVSTYRRQYSERTQGVHLRRTKTGGYRLLLTGTGQNAYPYYAWYYWYYGHASYARYARYYPGEILTAQFDISSYLPDREYGTSGVNGLRVDPPGSTANTHRSFMPVASTVSANGNLVTVGQVFDDKRAPNYYWWWQWGHWWYWSHPYWYVHYYYHWKPWSYYRYWDKLSAIQVVDQLPNGAVNSDFGLGGTVLVQGENYLRNEVAVVSGITTGSDPDGRGRWIYPVGFTASRDPLKNRYYWAFPREVNDMHPHECFVAAIPPGATQNEPLYRPFGGDPNSPGFAKWHFLSSLDNSQCSSADTDEKRLAVGGGVNNNGIGTGGVQRWLPAVKQINPRY